jgi:hypothetical protein
MAYPWAEALTTAQQLRYWIDLFGTHAFNVLRETPAGVLLVVGLATMWVGWLTRKRKDRE